MKDVQWLDKEGCGEWPDEGWGEWPEEGWDVWLGLLDEKFTSTPIRHGLNIAQYRT